MIVLHYGALESAHETRLRERLGDGVDLQVLPREDRDAALALAPRLDGIVGGRIPPELLAAARALRFQLIPYAGVPAQDRAQLAGRPALRLYNSHYNAAPTAEHAWALLLAAAKRVVPASDRLARGDWTPRYEGPLSLRLAGRRLLIVGYGAIGRILAGYGRAFDMSVSAVNRRGGDAEGLERLGGPEDLPGLLTEADAVICCLPDTPATAGLIGATAFAALKPGAVLVNVGRGTALDEDAFFAALASGRLGAAAIDTWWRYPESAAARRETPPSHHDLDRFENLVLSPHRASHVAGREEARMDDIARILNAIAAGAPPRAVDREHWY